MFQVEPESSSILAVQPSVSFTNIDDPGKKKTITKAMFISSCQKQKAINDCCNKTIIEVEMGENEDGTSNNIFAVCNFVFICNTYNNHLTKGVFTPSVKTVDSEMRFHVEDIHLNRSCLFHLQIRL